METYHVLFLCTGNSARSIMAEALATIESNGRFIGHSAGPKPVGTVNPFALELLGPLGYPLSQLRSKHWDEFALPGAPEMDFIITLCDSAAGEPSPAWPGHPATAYWHFPDPVAVNGSDEEKHAIFKQVFHGISSRLHLLLALPLEKLDASSLHPHLQNISESSLRTA
jgi:arsenate reductase